MKFSILIGALIIFTFSVLSLGHPKLEEPNDTLKMAEHTCPLVDHPRFKDIPPNECRCWRLGAFAGKCTYQAFSNDSTFSTLKIGIANVISDFNINKTFNAANLAPRQGPGEDTIEWWYMDEKGEPDMAMNNGIGKYLIDNDEPSLIQEQVQASIEILIFSFQKGYQRDLGVQVGAFVGKQTLTTLPPKFSQTLQSGILKLMGGIGNPLASFLNLGISAMVNTNRAEEVTRTIVPCTVGSSCTNGTTSSNNYFKGNVDTKTDKIGLNFSTTVDVDRKDKNILVLKNLTIGWGTPTGNADNPVSTTTIADGNKLRLTMDELVPLYMNTVQRDIKTGQLFDRGKTTEFDQTIAMIRVAKITSQEGAYTPVELKEREDRTYTPAEKAKLGTTSIRDFLSSIQVECVPNLIVPSSKGSVCGFKFSKMGENLIDSHLHFHLEGKLQYDQPRDHDLTTGDVYKDKGKYQLPLLDDSGAHDYYLTVTFHPSSKVDDMIKNERTRGMVVHFTYYPDAQENSIDFDSTKTGDSKNKKPDILWLK